MGIVGKFASLVKFSHTIFAMPFALAAYLYALTESGLPFDGIVLLKMVLCMVFARNAAMGFNRWADRKMDARNPRTSGREIPSGKISPRAALGFVAVNAVLFIVSAGLINRLALMLAPVALFILLSYSYTKRFTAWCHLVLGVSLGMAPAGAFIAVTGASPVELLDMAAVVPMLLSGLVITWVTGFDMLYALQDTDFDRAQGLHSAPVRWSPAGANAISITLHIFSLFFVALIGMMILGNWIYWLGAGIFALLLIAEHILHTPTPSGVTRLKLSFGLVNGFSSLAYAICFILSILIR